MNESGMAFGACIEHAERTGTPCVRCGTFRCGECLTNGYCRLCGSIDEARSPTPEDVVGFGPRAGARLIDFVAGYLAAMVGGIFMGMAMGLIAGMKLIDLSRLKGLDFGSWSIFALTFLSFALAAAVTTAITGTSIGKAILGLRVVSLEGRRPTLGQSLVREFGYAIDGMFFGLVARASMNGTPLRQRLGDQRARTTVVRIETIAPALRASPIRIGVGIVLGYTVGFAGLTVAVIVLAIVLLSM